MGDHLIVLHSAVRACAGYSRHDAPSMLLDGSSIARDTEHGRAITAQLDLTSVLDLVIDVAVDLLAGTAGLIALIIVASKSRRSKDRMILQAWRKSCGGVTREC